MVVHCAVHHPVPISFSFVSVCFCDSVNYRMTARHPGAIRFGICRKFAPSPMNTSSFVVTVRAAALPPKPIFPPEFRQASADRSRPAGLRRRSRLCRR